MFPARFCLIGRDFGYLEARRLSCNNFALEQSFMISFIICKVELKLCAVYENRFQHFIEMNSNCKKMFNCD